jgi:hypothetical protein
MRDIALVGVLTVTEGMVTMVVVLMPIEGLMIMVVVAIATIHRFLLFFSLNLGNERV